VQSNVTIVVAVVIVAAVIVALVLLLAQRRKKTQALQQRFGKEYQRTVTERGSEREAQAVLEQRQERVARFNIRRLAPDERDRYAEKWRVVQSHFVDDPKAAVIEADDTVQSVMTEQGYPMSNFEQRAADLSVDHANVVQNYRAAHQIAARHRQGRATTEDLRQAMIYYRSLFEDLLNGRTPGGVREVA
jgi:hypothetical protein